MFEVNGYIGHPLNFGVFTDYVIDEETLRSIVQENKNAFAIDAKQEIKEIKGTYTPHFFIVAEFENKKTKKIVRAINNDGIRWGKRFIDDTLVISFNVSDVGKTLGMGDWDVSIVVNELIIREEILEEKGVLHIIDGEPTAYDLAMSKSWATTEDDEGKKYIPESVDWDLSIKKNVDVETKLNRLQTCIGCEFQAMGECRAVDVEDSFTWVDVLGIISDGSCPKNYWDK